jgi:hypothetical protein
MPECGGNWCGAREERGAAENARHWGRGCFVVVEAAQ